jgi:hypothetical protein
VQEIARREQLTFPSNDASPCGECMRAEFRTLDFKLLLCSVCCTVCFLLGNSPASEFYMPTFRNTLFIPSS